MKEPINKIVFSLSVIIALLIIIASSTGLFSLQIYSRESVNWGTQSLGQDVIDLFLIMPSLVITSILVVRKKRIGMMLWSGVVFYIIYTFTIYCFSLHFNKLFVVYCTILGLSFYSFIYVLLSFVREPFAGVVTNKSARKITAIYFISIACLFYLLWLSQIVPAIMNNITPTSLIETGLLTNPVHVIDLSVCLPALFITGILVFKRNVLGSFLAPAMLVFCFLMDITISVLVILMKSKGLEGDYSVTVIMNALALISIVLLVWYLKNIELMPNKEKNVQECDATKVL
jgi:hypothetical protein